MLVVDDGSPDGTGDEADRLASASAGRIVVIHRTGAAVLACRTWTACGRPCAMDATHVCQMDADFSHDPADVPRLLEAARSADLVIGSRYVAGRRAARLAATSPGPERVREPLRAHDHPPAGARLHERLPLLAARVRWRDCRSIASFRMATRSRSSSHGKLTAPRAGSSRCPSRSSNAATASPSCPDA